MKRLCVYMLTLFLLCTGAAQCAEVPLSVSTQFHLDFNHAYDPPLPLYDGGLLITGYTKAVESGSSKVLLRLDASGNELWRQEETIRSGDSIFSIVPIEQDGFISLYKHESDLDYRLTFIGPDGQILWDKPVESFSTHHHPSPQLHAAPNGFLLSYIHSTRKENGTFYVFGVERWNAAGERMWTHLLEEQEFAVHAILPLPEGGYALCGNLEDQQSGGQRYTAAAVVKLTEDGTLAWLHASPFEGWRNLTGVTLLSDGSLLATGEETTQGAGSDDSSARPFALRLDAHGIPLWERSYEGREHSCWFVYPPLAVDDSVLVSVKDVAHLYPRRVLQLDAQGNLTGEYRTPPPTVQRVMRPSLWQRTDGSVSLLLYAEGEDRQMDILDVYPLLP